MKDFNDAADLLRDRVNDRQSGASDAENLLRRASAIASLMSRFQLETAAQRDWKALRLDMNDLTRAYGIAWNWSAASQTMPARTSTTETSFAQLLFPGPLRNRVIAASRVRPPIPFAYGNAIVALRQDCPNGNTGGIHFDGDAIVTITQGGTFSNACYVKDGGVEVDVTSGENICLGTGCWTNNGGSGYVNPEPYNGDRDLPPFSYSLPLPDCYAADMIDQGSHHGGSDILDPGRYDSIRINNNDVVTLNPVLYCVMDDNFTVTGGELYGDGVTIFVNSGDFETNGSAHIELEGRPRLCPIRQHL